MRILLLLSRPIKMKPRTMAWLLFAIFAQIEAPLASSETGLEGAVSPAQSSSASSSGGTCVASSPASFRACADQANLGAVSVIQIAALIGCSAADSCNVSLKNISGPLTIAGTGGTGFVRHSGYGDSLIEVLNSQNIKLESFSIDDTKNKLGRPDKSQGYTRGNKSCDGRRRRCQAAIFFSKSNNVIINDLTINNSKKIAIGLKAVHNVTVSNSRIYSAFAFGIWSVEGSNQYFADNQFKNIRSNAIIFSIATAHIKNNYFDHNHYTPAFNVCGKNSNEPCPGGQLLVLADSSNIKIEENTFTRQLMKGDLIGQGIEFDYSATHKNPIVNVSIRKNRFIKNKATAAFINKLVPKGAIRQIEFANNQVFSNQSGGYGDIALPKSSIKNNCFKQKCPGIR